MACEDGGIARVEISLRVVSRRAGAIRNPGVIAAACGNEVTTVSRTRPTRLRHIAGIGVDRMGSIADASGKDFLRLENLDVDIPPDVEAVARTREAANIGRPTSP